MIACISPGSSSADHSVNTLRYIVIIYTILNDSFNRYADRLKDRSGNVVKGAKYDPNQPIDYDNEDIKAMAADDFAKSIMRPFLSRLSINAYETTYGMERASADLYRRSLLEDLLDTGTLVDHER